MSPTSPSSADAEFHRSLGLNPRDGPWVRPLDHSEKVPDVHAQCFGELMNVCQRDVVLTAFDPARIGAMNTGQVGQCLLAQTTLLPEHTKAGAEGRFPVGGLGSSTPPGGAVGTSPGGHIDSRR